MTTVSIWKRMAREFLELVAAIALTISLTTSALSETTGKMELEQLSADDPYHDYIVARAAAEVCLHRSLNEDEHKRFVVSLSYRDTRRRPMKQLSADVDRDLNRYRKDFEAVKCEREDIHQALFDWELRVAAFVGIPSKNVVAEPPQETAISDEQKGAF